MHNDDDDDDDDDRVGWLLTRLLWQHGTDVKVKQ